MVNLPEPVFIDTNPETIITELVNQFETITNRKLYPAQVERLLLDIIAYRETLLRIGIQEAAKQNLLAYATGVMLDHLGLLTGAERLPARPAVTTIRFEIETPLDIDITIPAGTEIEAKDGKYTFRTDRDVTIKSGQTYADVSATCTTATEQANGYLPGDVSNPVSFIPYINRCYNITVTFGGAEEEEDERYRQRIRESIERFSNAGSRGAYRYWAMTAHQDIVDVSVYSSQPGVVNVFVLTKQAQPDTEVVNQVSRILNDEKIRPLTDQVIVSYAQKVEYQITANITKYKDLPDPTQIVLQKLQNFTKQMQQHIGKDIRRSRIIAEIQSVYGVESVELLQPATDIILSPSQFPVCTSIQINLTGASNDPAV